MARGGVDLIRARGGRDFICAGRGEVDFIFAGAGNDRIKGGRGFDITFTGGGNDLVDGGPNFDYVTYEGRPTAVDVDLGEGTAEGQGSDRLVRIEGVAGSEGDDRLVGTDGDNDLLGYGGNDTIIAGGGNDFLNSGAGNDNVDGGSGSDFVDMAFSNAGPKLDDDTLTDAGATINLATGTASGPEGVGDDILTGIEGVGGTLGDDTMVGNDVFNELAGFEGDDTISLGGAGEADPLGTQNVAIPGSGNDTVTGSTGMDAVDYGFLSLVEDPTVGATIDLAAGTATGDSVGTDQLTSFESAVGTVLDDVITGTAQSNVLIGIDGSDSIEGAAGDDILDGDAYVFGLNLEFDGTDALDGGPGTDTCVGGSAADTDCEISELPAPASAASWTALTSRPASTAVTYYRYLTIR